VLFPRVPAGGSCGQVPASSVHLGFARGYDPTWRWDAASHRFARFYGSAPFVDAERGPIAVENVVVQLVRYRGAGGGGQLLGEGDAWVLCGGRATQARWSKPDNQTPTVFRDTAGNPLLLDPGKTWVELLPTGSAVDITP